MEKLNERLFESRSHARVIAERMALESLEFYYEDRCALICLTWDQIQAAGVAGAELEDLTSLPRSIEGVEVGLTLRQQKDGSFKISVRTGHDTNACNIARRLGGGGHPRAAGCEISGNPGQRQACDPRGSQKGTGPRRRGESAGVKRRNTRMVVRADLPYPPALPRIHV